MKEAHTRYFYLYQMQAFLQHPFQRRCLPEVQSPQTYSSRSVLGQSIAMLVVGVLLAIGVGLSSCNEPPTTVGGNFITDTLAIKVVTSEDSLLITGGGAFLSEEYFFNQGGLYIGTTPTVSAASMIRFVNIPDTLGSINPADIISTTLVIQPLRYVFGDSTANQLNFSILELTQPFIEPDTTTGIRFVSQWSKFFGANGDITPNASRMNLSAIGTYSGQIPLRDTMPAIEIPLNTQGNTLVAQWIRNNADSNLRKLIYGIALVPQVGSTVVRGFSTQSSRVINNPLVRIRTIYRRPNSGGIVDTLLLASGNDVTMFSGPQAQNPLIALMNTVSYEARYNIDCSFIGKFDVINSGQVEITIDTTKSTKSNRAFTEQFLLTLIDSTRNFSFSTSAVRKAGSNKVLFSNAGDLLGYAQRVNGGKAVLAVRAVTPFAERFEMYGMNAPLQTQRPFMKVLYSPRPDLGRDKK